MTTTHDSKETLNELLDRAAAEKNREKFLELLREIGQRVAGKRESPKALRGVQFQPAMDTDTFDLFAGAPDRYAVWQESVVGLEHARKRMEQIAAAAPGQYFIFYERSRSVMARINSGPVPSAEIRRRDSAAGAISFLTKIRVAS
jgi:hypothetical protein